MENTPLKPAKIFAFMLSSALLGGIAGSYLTSTQLQASLLDYESETTAQETSYLEESQVIDTVQSVSPSVVSIVVSKDLPLYRQGFLPFGNDPFFNFGVPYQEYDRDEEGNIKSERVQVGGGSGFIISEDGLIVTNRHVVDDEEASYTVVTSDGREFEADVLARDTLSDFAVLRLIETEENPVKGLSFVELGDSDALQIGQKVVAIGNALAEYQNTVTTGVVSGMGRNITAGSLQSSEDLVNLIQTDAAINPGNSGGPLVNLKGQVVGINTAIAANGEGIGFAIPINDVKLLIHTVEETGEIIRPYLGVRFMMLDEKKADELQIEVEGGAVLVGNEAEGEFAVIPGSPADKAGLKIKDVILEVDGETVDLEHPLHHLLAQKPIDEPVILTIWRSGETMKIEVTLEAAQ